ncbi:MAG: hypothetical protein ACQESD_00515 [Thermoplasmatota archaeon]
MVMRIRRKNLSLEGVIKSYVLAQKEKPYKKIKLLQIYLKAMGIADPNLRELRDMIKKEIEREEKRMKIERSERTLFTKDEIEKENKYGSAYCDNCSMYKDYEKECPYCGSLEMTF